MDFVGQSQHGLTRKDAMEELEVRSDPIDAESFAALLVDYAQEMDELERFDPNVYSLLREHGIWRVAHGKGEDGGNLTSQCRWIEALAARCTSTAVLVQSQLTVAHTLMLSGSAVVADLIEEMRDGTIWGWGLTESEAGSDILSMATTARDETGGFIINGSKRFISNAGIASYYLVFARTDPRRGSRSISVFAVPTDTCGLSVSRYEHKMGLRASPTGDIVLDDVHVPYESLVGEIGGGVNLALSTLRWSRPLIGAVSVGVARGAYEELIHLVAPNEEAIKLSVGKHQARGHRIAELLTQVMAARALLYDVTERADASGALPPMWEASSVKAFCSESAMMVASAAVELGGRQGVEPRAPLQRYFRDAKVLQIFEGTNQIQKNAIMKELGAVSFAFN